MTNNILSVDSHKSFDNGKEEPEWTIECLIDEVFLNLASTKETITNYKGRTITVRKYYNQARQLMQWIPIAKPPPDFIINISDLTSSKLKEEIVNLVHHPKTMQHVITQGVGRIFENLDFDYYHLSIAKNLRVRFEP
ncbi:MAG TPA: hypothetical protein VIP70_04805 [Nitrososphaeraceae archaeon]